MATIEVETEAPAKTKRPVSPEQRERLSAQLAKGRETRQANIRKAKERTAEDVRDLPAPRSAGQHERVREDLSQLPGAEFTRRKREERTIGSFDVPAEYKKPGWDYQYIAIRVLNEPVDGARLRDFRMGGWIPVLKRDMPDIADETASDDAPIETEGQRLYTRPMRLTREAKEEDLQYAQRQQREKMQSAAEGREDGLQRRGVVRAVGGAVELEGVAGTGTGR